MIEIKEFIPLFVVCAIFFITLIVYNISGKKAKGAANE